MPKIFMGGYRFSAGERKDSENIEKKRKYDSNGGK
jgi:hypothetical protein